MEAGCIVAAGIGAGPVAGSHFEIEAEVVVGIAEDPPCSSSEADSREGNNSAVGVVGWNFAVGHCRASCPSGSQ